MALTLKAAILTKVSKPRGIHMQTWLTAVNIYCERLDASFWAEPVNALTNLAFMAAAWLIWRQAEKGTGARFLAICVALIGVGSFLFHTFGNRLTGLLDVAFIAVFLVAFAYLLPRTTWAQTRWRSALSVLLTLGVIALVTRILGHWQQDLPWVPPGLYVGAWLSLLIYATLTHNRRLFVARYLWLGAGIFVVSLTARQLDTPLCDQTGGLHWLWHLCNAAVLWSCSLAIRRVQTKSV